MFNFLKRHRPSPAPVERQNDYIRSNRGILLSGGDSPTSDPALAAHFLQSTPIFSALTLRSEAVARPTLQLLRPSGASMNPLDNHPASQYLNDPLSFTTTSTILRITEAHLNIWGVAYWLPRSTPRPHLKILLPTITTPQVDRAGEITAFSHHGPTGTRLYSPEEVVYFRNLNPTAPHLGIGPMTPATTPTQAAEKANEWNETFYLNGARPDFILFSEEPLPQTVIDDFYRTWEQRFQGIANARRPAIASQMRSLANLGVSQVDMDFINSLRWSLEEVGRAFGIPQTLLGNLDRATFSNFIESERIFWRNTVVPRLEYIQQELNEQFLPKIMFPQLRFRFDISSIEAMADDSREAAHRDALLLDQGVLTINEVRQRRNLDPVPWGNEPWEGRGRVAGGNNTQ